MAQRVFCLVIPCLNSLGSANRGFPLEVIGIRLRTERVVRLFLQSCVTDEFRLSPGGGAVTDDSSAYGTEDEPVDIHRDDISDPTKEE